MNYTVLALITKMYLSSHVIEFFKINNIVC